MPKTAFFRHVSPGSVKRPTVSGMLYLQGLVKICASNELLVINGVLFRNSVANSERCHTSKAKGDGFTKEFKLYANVSLRQESVFIQRQCSLLIAHCDLEC